VTTTDLLDRLRGDLTEAIRQRDEVTAATLRMALAAVSKAERAGSSQVTLTNQQVVEVLRREAKQRREAAEVYESAGRDDRAARELAELAVVERYLPPAMGDEELVAVVAEEVARAAEAGRTGPRAMGPVVQAVRARVGDGADGSRVASAVKVALGVP
jgi:uncharacterized protein YqeY